MSIDLQTIGGVRMLGMPWTLHPAGFAASAKHSGYAAVARLGRNAAAANVASVQRGTT